MQPLLQQQFETIQTKPLEDAWSELQRQYSTYLPAEWKQSWMTWWLPGEGESFDFTFLFKKILQFFFHEIVVNGHLLTTLVVLAIFAALLDRLQMSFSNQHVAKLANMVMLMMLMSIAAHSLYVALGYARDAVAKMTDFMLAMFPMFLALLAVTGNFVSMLMIESILMLMTQSMSSLIHMLVFPLLFFAAILHMVSSLNEHYKVTRLADLMSTIAVTSLGVMFTVFLGVLSLQGAFGTAADGLTMRATKFVVGNFVPVVGRMFADATDTVFSASLIVKNTVGFAGLLIIFLICAFPALKVFVLALIYRICAALLQPLGNQPLVTCLETISKSLLYVFGTIASLGLMFFLALTILIGLGNAALMFR